MTDMPRSRALAWGRRVRACVELAGIWLAPLLPYLLRDR